ncbi:MAG: phosphoenolpyruvate carboxykinase, partial [Anaerolineae bacterium]
MLKLKEGIDILADIGGVNTLREAEELFQARCDHETKGKLSRISNAEALLKIANAISLTHPDQVFVNTGSDADRRRVRIMSLAKGEECPVAMKDHTIHFDLPEEQARIIDRTYYIVNEGENTSVLAQSIPRDEAHHYIKTHMTDIGRGKTLLVGFFSRGPIGAKAAIP